MQRSRSILICPCHDVTEYDIRRMVDEGYTSPETIKRATAVYMGSCQGKHCAPLVQDLLVELGVEKEGEQRRPTARASICPVVLGALVDPTANNDAGGH